MRTRTLSRFTLAALLLMPAVALAQTTTQGTGIDVEIYNPDDGSNSFVVDVGVPFWAYVYVRPGSTTASCSLACGTVDGGTAALSAGVIDIEFDPNVVSFLAAETNPDSAFAAVDGLIQEQNVASGRVGWALAGDWTVDGDPSSALKSACSMQMLDTAGWVFRVQLQLDVAQATSLIVRQQPDFELSFSDMCGGEAFTSANGGIDQVVGASVTDPVSLVTLFADGFETANTSMWSSVSP